MDIGVRNYKITINGKELSAEFMSTLEEVSIEDEINLPAMFSIRLSMIDYQNGKLQGVDLKSFKPGDKVKISFGLDEVEPMLSGEITSIEINLGEHSIVELRGYDLLHRLRLGTKNKTFVKKKDSEIASDIARENGLSAVVDDTKTVYPYTFQNNQSNYEFLLQKAMKLDYEMYVEDKNFYFVKSRSKKDSSLPDLEFRKDFDELTLDLRSLVRGSKVEVRGWDAKEKKEISGQAKKGDEVTKMGGKQSGFELSAKAIAESPIAIHVENLIDRNEAKNIANAAYNNLLRDFITGEVRCKGNPKLRAGKAVKLKGIDERFSGTYYIFSSSHIIDKTKGYLTTFKVKRAGI